jgi:isocitrate dehydrogenase (NAD+)
LIPGDGIGPEVTASAREVVRAAGADISWVEASAGLTAAEKLGDPLPKATLELIRRYRVALKGPCTTPVGKGFRSINVALRQGLDLYASVRPVHTLPGVNVPYRDVDLIVVRENTEGLYSGLEHFVVPGVVEGLRIITRNASERIVRFAFELARHAGRRGITFCHRADVLPQSDGLFLESARTVADDYPFLEFAELHVDALCLQLALEPTRFDVLVMENLFGDVISDLCAGLVGGLGLVPGANIGTRYAVFEAVHGSAPDLAGKGLANPIAVVRSAAMLLEHIGQAAASRRIEESVARTLQDGKGLTRDLGGDGTTASITERLIANLAGVRGQGPGVRNEGAGVRGQGSESGQQAAHSSLAPDPRPLTPASSGPWPLPPLRVTLIQGGGAGMDQVPAVRRILDAVGVRVDWDEHFAGLAALERGEKALPEAMLRSVRETGLALKTMLLSPPGPKEANCNVLFRKELGIFATIRPLKNIRGLPARFRGVDFVVIRELTEDLYAAVEHEIVPGVVQSIKIVTEAACRRFFRFAFDWTRGAGRKTVHCVHKANILKMADGLFLDTFRAVAREFPELQSRELIVDNCSMQLVLRPQQFDVLVMGNLYGDLVSDLGAGVVGGISATAGINFADGIRVYECFHGGSREAVGVNCANPLPLLLPAIDLLESVGQVKPARHILAAVEKVLADGKMRTPDLGGKTTTTEMADAIVAALA